MTTTPEPSTDEHVVDLDRLEDEVENLRVRYRMARPYPHIVLDDFLFPDAADRAIKEFPPLDHAEWNSYVHANERKFNNTEPETWGPTLQRILAELNSPRFVDFVGKLIGVDGLIPDPSLDGGGLHRTPSGGFLNVHTDFTVHPHRQDWQRRANLLLYLNEDWKPEYGGDLELWNEDMSRCVEKVAPVANRVLIFTTDARSLHGHPEPIRCPEGMARKSLALYYFSVEDDPLIRATDYRPRPGDGARAIMIRLDTHLLRAYDWARRRLGISDQSAGKVLAIGDRLFRRRHRSAGTAGHSAGSGGDVVRERDD